VAIVGGKEAARLRTFFLAFCVSTTKSLSPDRAELRGAVYLQAQSSKKPFIYSSCRKRQKWQGGLFCFFINSLCIPDLLFIPNP
jgi:hypothetical protein